MHILFIDEIDAIGRTRTGNNIYSENALNTLTNDAADFATHNRVTLTKTANGNGISYVVPQTYRLDNIEEEITFKFRVRKPYHMVKVVIKADDEVIRTIVKPHMLPAEMEMLKVKKSLLKECSTLTFEIKEG